MQPKGGSATRDLVVSLVLLVSACVFFIIVLEVTLRIFLPIYAPSAHAAHENLNLMEYNDKYGWFHKKGLSTWFETTEYSTYVYLNNKGLRGEERDYRKPQMCKRIVIIGDSFAFGLGVNDDDAFSVQLEKALNSKGKCFEVVNMGVNGYCTVQEWLLLKDEGMRYSPDIVICELFVGNDFTENSTGVQYDRNKPYLAYDNGTAVLKNYPVPAPEQNVAMRAVSSPELKGRMTVPFKSWFQNHSYAYIFLRLRYQYFLYRLGIRRSVDSETMTPDKAIGLTEVSLVKLQELCSVNNIRLLVLLVPTKEQLAGIEKNIPQDRLIVFFKSRKIEHIDLLPGMKGRRDLNYIIDSHWNKKGHKYVMGAILDHMNQNKAN